MALLSSTVTRVTHRAGVGYFDLPLSSPFQILPPVHLSPPRAPRLPTSTRFAKCSDGVDLFITVLGRCHERLKLQRETENSGI